MDQEQLDNLEKQEGDSLKEDFSEEYSGTEEKVNDVNGIINGDGDTENQNQPENKVPEESKISEEKSPPQDNWNFDDHKNQNSSQPKGSSTWKVISGILLILLIAAVYTNGFHLTGASTTSLTQIDAENKVLDYVNNNLLRPPFTAEVNSSEELDNLFKVTITVADQKIDSYITKDGKYFFPQGFDLETSIKAPENPQEPEAKLVEVSTDDDPVLGDQDAPVTIVEFSDFQCPYCGRAFETIKQIEKEYVESGKVKIVFRDFPLSFHPNAKPAAMAAECAHEQGKFWEFHDLLFTNQADLSAENYKKWAADLGLDTKQFDECLDTEKYKDEVEADIADGQKYGVSGTPAFFINGKLISGAQPYEVFKQAIEEALNTAEETTTAPKVEEKTAPSQEGTMNNSETAPSETGESGLKEIQVDVKKWRFDPKTIEVNQGDSVKLIINSEFDLNFVLADFDINEEILGGETKTIEFTADKTGTFEFNCGTYCYKTYGDVQGAALKGELVVN